MEMVNDFLAQELIRRIATFIFVGAVAFDFFLSYDKLPNNSVREWMLRRTQMGLSLLPGSVMPYALGVLLGHFYHPPYQCPPLPLEGYGNLILVVAIGVLLALSTHFYRFPQSRHVFGVAVFGIVVGALVWPV